MKLKAILKMILFRFAAVFIGLLFAAILAEVALRVLMPSRLGRSDRERDFFCRFDRQLGWAPLENITGVHKLSGLSVLVHQNQYGLRGPDDMQFNKLPGKKRILVFGDSYVWGFGTDQANLFSAPEVHGANEEILNFGVSGYGTDQEYLFYQLRGTKFVADEVVVALTPYNDIANNLASEQYSYLKPYFRLESGQLVLHDGHVSNSRFREIISGLSHHSRVWNLTSEFIRGAWDSMLMRLKPNTAEARYAKLDRHMVSHRDGEGVELTVAILKKFQEAAAAQKANFYVIFIPYMPHVEKHLPNNHPLVPLIAAGLTRVGVSYREPYPAFLKAAAAGAHLFNKTDKHFSPEGHTLFAKFLTDTDIAQASIDYYGRQ
jgi:hypothetical protein